MAGFWNNNNSNFEKAIGFLNTRIIFFENFLELKILRIGIVTKAINQSRKSSKNLNHVSEIVDITAKAVNYVVNKDKRTKKSGFFGSLNI
jgi:hypothetical protein